MLKVISLKFFSKEEILKIQYCLLVRSPYCVENSQLAINVYIYKYAAKVNNSN